MQCLLTKSDFNDVASLTPNLNFDTKLKPHVIVSQELQLSDWLGADFLAAIVNSPADYATLLNGEGSFTGIKRILVYLTMSKAIWDMNMELTDSGTMFKNNEYSTPASASLLSRKSKDYENLSNAYWLKAEAYLNANRAQYTLWRTDVCCESKTLTVSRITAISAPNYQNKRYYDL